MVDSGSISALILSTNETADSERDVDWGIVQEICAGNLNAFDRLVRKYRERTFSVIYNMTGNREEATDLTQEIFIKALQSVGRFKGKSSCL